MIVERWVWTRAPETVPGPLHSRQPQGHSIWVIEGGEGSERGRNSQGTRRKCEQSTGPKAKECPGEKRSEIKATELLSEAAARRSAATLSGAGPGVAEGREQRGRGMKVEDRGAE